MRILLTAIKKLINNKIEKIKSFFNEKVKYLEAYTEEKDFSQLKFDDLAPKDDLEKCSQYCDAIDWCIENEKIFNIALTGPYGSGKSSILKTYQKNHINNKYLNISLASFQVIIEDEDNKDDNIDNEIEKGILQQLFYKVDSKRIPYTRFRKIKNSNSIKIFKDIFLICISVVLGLIIFVPNIIAKVSENIETLNNNINNEFIVYVIYSGFIFLIFYNIFRLIKYFKSKIKLSAITFEKAEIELEEQGSESIFNKYLDEILYFFEVTKYNVVMIEDLDRFNNTKIFTKLRELNQLINNYEKIKRKIVFLYAVKDDMFKEDERTKFFDFIIPVIPVINSINSGDILLKKIKQDNLGDDISQEFVNGVSVYIEDMRMLTNIYNEYRLYKVILNDISLKSEKILALVIYKNLYPADFAKLLYNEGIVYEAFKYKITVVKNETEKINSEIDKIKLKLEQTKNESLSNIRELKGAFLSLIEKENFYIYRIDDYSKSEFLNDNFDIDKIFKNKDSLNYYYYSSYGYQRNDGKIKFKDIDSMSSSKYTFKERFENIKYKEKEKEEELKNKIHKLEEKIRELKSLKLENLINEFGVKYVLPEIVIKEKPIVYLIRHGKIDETYINYLTYFYDNNITVEDMNFILSIRNYERKEFDYNLNKLEQLISKLNEYEFSQKEILNFNLIEFLLKNKSKYNKQLNNLIKQLSDESELSIRFIDEFKDYINNKEEEYDFWNLICKSWNRLWSTINNRNYTQNKINTYMEKIIKYVDVDCIEEININNEFSQYIENNREFLKIVSLVELDKVKNVIKTLNIKFNVIEIINVNEDLLNYIWDECYYDIDKKIMEDILIVKFNYNINDIRQRNFTTIKKSGYESLINYIKENIYKYITKVFLPIEKNVREDLDNIIELLNWNVDVLPKETKLKIINKENFELLNLEDIPEELWEEILKSLKIKVNWNNVLKYYNYIGKLDDILIQYLNNKKVYSSLVLTMCEKEELIISFFTSVTKNENISTDSFKELIKSMPFIYTLEYSIDEFCEKFVDILIENNKIEFNSDTYEIIRDNFKDKHIRFIEKNFENYITNIEEFTTDSNDLCKILKLSTCKFEEIQSIILKINKDLVNKNILNEDLEKIICNIIFSDKKKINLGYELYLRIFNNLDHDKKIKLLTNQSKFLKKEYIDNSLNLLGEPFSKISSLGSKEKVEYSTDVNELADSLVECEYISSKSISRNKNLGRYVQFNAKRR